MVTTDTRMVTLSQVVEGFILAGQARRLSPATLADYGYTFRKLSTYLGNDPPLHKISVTTLRAFLASQSHLSRKSVLNQHIALSALWTWAVKEGLVVHHVMRDIPPPRAECQVIVPFSLDDIRVMLSVLDKSQPYKRPGKRESRHSLIQAQRNRAIILMLLDTGVRSSELCGLLDQDVDLSGRRIVVAGKGAKHRMLPFSERTGQALWRYRATVRAQIDHPAPQFFLTVYGKPLRRESLLSLLRDIGKRAGVADVHPHRFRHTFALSALQNGMSVFHLQRLLGHSSLEMVRRYLALSQADLDTAHRQASPVANWKL